MRMRKRHNLEPRMEKCAELLVREPESYKGKWKSAFADSRELHLELGCGKGRFTVEAAGAAPELLLVALEKVPDAMVIAMERARDAGLRNLRFIDGDAADLADIFDKGEVDRIYINFCDPWPKSRDAKFRLTAPSFLRLYCQLLPIGGQIHFKTDNGPLFDWSVDQLRAELWQLSELTEDLHAPGMPATFVTDYEQKFMDGGVRINRLVAERTGETKGFSAGAVPRIRNAALADARGGLQPPLPEDRDI